MPRLKPAGLPVRTVPIPLPATLHVLLVEDQEDHFTLIRRQLERAAGDTIELSHVTTLASAKEAVRDGKFDAVLLDLSLPDSTMAATLREVMAEAKRAAVIVLTSLDDVAFATSAVASGAQDFLPKSRLDGALLLRSIRYSVQRKLAVRELEKRNRELLRVAETVAHEVRTPLHVVSCCLQVLEKRCASVIDTELHELIDESRNSMHDVARLTRRLLEFATVGVSERAFVKVDLNEIFDSALALLETEGSLESAVITRDDLPEVSGDEVLLRQVFVNLVGNAVKYRRDDEVPVIRLLCEADDEAKVWRMTLRDNGRGIAPEAADRIFDIFQRGSDVDDIGGKGIGLAFCKKVIEHHGGSISAVPAEVEGSKFLITLPVVEGYRRTE